MADEAMLPPGTFFPDDDEMDRYFEEMGFGLMQRAGEPSLWKLSVQPDYHAYRFRWEGGRRILGPLVIRLVIQPDGSGVATIKIWKSIPVEYDPETSTPDYDKSLQAEYTKPISRRNMKKFLHQIEKAGFWELPTEDNHQGLDGETWNLEGAKNGKFHFVTRWVPRDWNFIRIGFVLLRICKLPNEYFANIYLNWLGDRFTSLVSAVSSWGYKLITGKTLF
jgi:hypothetical protein